METSHLQTAPVAALPSQVLVHGLPRSGQVPFMHALIKHVPSPGRAAVKCVTGQHTGTKGVEFVYSVSIHVCIHTCIQTSHTRCSIHQMHHVCIAGNTLNNIVNKVYVF